MFQYKLYTSIKSINKESWNSIIRENNIINCYDYLKAIEESNFKDCKFYYIVYYNDEKEIIAHVSFYTMKISLITLYNNPVFKLLKIIKKLFPEFLMVKIIECGSFVSVGKSICINNQKDINVEYILKKTIEVMLDLGKKTESKILIMREFIDTDELIINNLCDTALTKCYTLPNIVINICWKTFDGYINDLKYNYRRLLKKRLNKIKEENIIIEKMYDFDTYIPKLYELYLNCYNNAKEYQKEILNKEYFKNINKYLISSTLVLLLKKENNVIGFALIAEDDEILRLLFIGLDYRVNKEYFTYFNLLYNVLKHAIENNFKQIDLGVTTYETKQKLGGEIKTQYFYMKIFNKFINNIFTRISKYFFPKVETKSYHPFKSRFYK